MTNYPKRKPKLNEYDLTHDYGIGYTSKGEEFYFDLKVCLHRLVTNCPKGMVVDHINHDTRDNRKTNLRVCTHAENNHNRSPKNGECCGVSYMKANKKWYARIGDSFLGYFLTKEEAVAARRKAEIEKFGEYSYTLSIEKGRADERIT